MAYLAILFAETTVQEYDSGPRAGIQEALDIAASRQEAKRWTV